MSHPSLVCGSNFYRVVRGLDQRWSQGRVMQFQNSFPRPFPLPSHVGIMLLHYIACLINIPNLHPVHTSYCYNKGHFSVTKVSLKEHFLQMAHVDLYFLVFFSPPSQSARTQAQGNDLGCSPTAYFALQPFVSDFLF